MPRPLRRWFGLVSLKRRWVSGWAGCVAGLGGWVGPGRGPVQAWTGTAVVTCPRVGAAAWAVGSRRGQAGARPCRGRHHTNLPARTQRIARNSHVTRRCARGEVRAHPLPCIAVRNPQMCTTWLRSPALGSHPAPPFSTTQAPVKLHRTWRVAWRVPGSSRFDQVLYAQGARGGARTLHCGHRGTLAAHAVCARLRTLGRAGGWVGGWAQ